MADKNKVSPQALEAMKAFQFEIASENDKIPMGYAGTVGGSMVKKMVKMAEEQMIKQNRD